MKRFLWGAASLLALSASEAMAQSAPNEVGEIVVTAQKREQSIQDTPLAISAFGSAALEKLQVNDVSDLASVAPGLQGSLASSGQPLLSVRGIGSNDFSVGADPALGIYIDEVYAGRSAGAVTNLFDIDRVEVLRGPQGTLFGRNTTAGAISIVRNAPSRTFEGSAEVGYGSFDDITAQGVLSGPISEKAALRAGIYYRTRDGFYDRLPGGKLGNIDTVSARAALRLEPTTSARIDLSLDYQRDDQSSAIYQSRTFNGPYTDLGYYDTTTNLTQDQLHNRRDVYMASARANLDLGAFSLTSTTAFRTYDFDYQEDTDGGPANLLTFSIDENQDAFSQEVRLNYAGERLEWFLGASYFTEDVRQTTRANYSEEDVCGAIGRVSIGATLSCGVLLNALSGGQIPASFVGLPSVTDVTNAKARYSSVGVYSDLTYHASDALRLTLGVRFSRDDKKAVVSNPAPTSTVAPILLGSPTVFLEATAAPVTLKESWSDWSPRVALQYDVNEDLMVYGSIARGYKSGGFNLLVPSGGAFDPETVTSYDLGLKGTLAEGRVSFDAAAFYYVYKNLQVQIVNAFPTTENAGSARGYGLETSFRARPVDGLNLGGSLTLLNAEYTRYSPSAGVDYEGNRLNRAPRVATSLYGDYTFVTDHGDLTLGAKHRYESDTFHSPDNNQIQFSPAHAIADAWITWAPSRTWRVTLFANNIFDEHYVTQTQQLTALQIAVFQAGEPRTVGLRLNAEF